jgi:hypothetical protein
MLCPLEQQWQRLTQGQATMLLLVLPAQQQTPAIKVLPNH